MELQPLRKGCSSGGLDRICREHLQERLYGHRGDLHQDSRQDLRETAAGKKLEMFLDVLWTGLNREGNNLEGGVFRKRGH